MSTEEVQPSKRPPSYKRRIFDPEKHCGAPKDRNPDHLREMIEKFNAVIKRLTETAANEGREPAVHEKAWIKKKSGRIAMLYAQLEKLEKYGPDDRPCMAVKGYGTTHPGTGSCRFHCECKGREGFHLTNKFSYSRKATEKKLRDLIDELERSNHDALDLEPEIHMIRAKMQLFIQEKGDFDPETVRSLTILAEQLRKTVETVNAGCDDFRNRRCDKVILLRRIHLQRLDQIDLGLLTQEEKDDDEPTA